MHVVMVYQHFMVSGVGSTKPYDLARYLQAAGHRVTVICGRGYLSQGMKVPRGPLRRLDIDGLKVLCIGVDYRQKMGFLRRVNSFLTFTFMAMLTVLFMPRFDVLLASSTPLTVGLTGLVAKHLRRRPWVFELRDLWPDFPVRAGYLKNRALIAISRFFERWFYRSATTVTAISQRMCDYLLELGLPQRKVVFIPTGVDLSTALAASPNADWWQERGLENMLRAVYLGAHGPANGLQYLLEAASHLRPEDRIKIVLIGEGVQKPMLMEQARKRNLTELIFLPTISRDLVPGILQGANIALMIDQVTPGAETSMPNKLFDYLAAAMPVVTNNPAELWEHLDRAKCGLLVDNDRPEHLVEVLRRLRDDADLVATMGSNACKLAREQFDRQELNCRWEQLLRGVPPAE